MPARPSSEGCRVNRRHTAWRPLWRSSSSVLHSLVSSNVGHTHLVRSSLHTTRGKRHVSSSTRLSTRFLRSQILLLAPWRCPWHSSMDIGRLVWAWGNRGRLETKDLHACLEAQVLGCRSFTQRRLWQHALYTVLPSQGTARRTAHKCRSDSSRWHHHAAGCKCLRTNHISTGNPTHRCRMLRSETRALDSESENACEKALWVYDAGADSEERTYPLRQGLLFMKGVTRALFSWERAIRTR
jgi:hypothetical protein